VLAGFARQFNPLSLSKAGYHAGLTSLLLLMGAGSVHDATALNETRTLSFHHTHSDEDITVTFKRDGRYDEEALKQLNHYLRDWRSQEETTMDRHMFDILLEDYRDVDGVRVPFTMKVLSVEPVSYRFRSHRIGSGSTQSRSPTQHSCWRVFAGSIRKTFSPGTV